MLSGRQMFKRFKNFGLEGFYGSGGILEKLFQNEQDFIKCPRKYVGSESRMDKEPHEWRHGAGNTG